MAFKVDALKFYVFQRIKFDTQNNFSPNALWDVEIVNAVASCLLLLGINLIEFTVKQNKQYGEINFWCE